MSYGVSALRKFCAGCKECCILRGFQLNGRPSVQLPTLFSWCETKKQDYGVGSTMFGISEVEFHFSTKVRIKGVVGKGWTLDKRMILMYFLNNREKALPSGAVRGPFRQGRFCGVKKNFFSQN